MSKQQLDRVANYVKLTQLAAGAAIAGLSTVSFFQDRFLKTDPKQGGADSRTRRPGEEDTGAVLNFR
jgi:hypothetical protein